VVGVGKVLPQASVEGEIVEGASRLCMVAPWLKGKGEFHQLQGDAQTTAAAGDTPPPPPPPPSSNPEVLEMSVNPKQSGQIGGTLEQAEGHEIQMGNTKGKEIESDAYLGRQSGSSNVSHQSNSNLVFSGVRIVLTLKGKIRGEVLGSCLSVLLVEGRVMFTRIAGGLIPMDLRIHKWQMIGVVTLLPYVPPKWRGMLFFAFQIVLLKLICERGLQLQ
jgi:hypothetical protein